MSDATQEKAAGPALAHVAYAQRWSSVWLVPLVAFGIGIWMVYAHYSSQGPLISIGFATAEGIEPDKTKVRAKNVEIGEVMGVRLAEDARSVLLSVRVHKESEYLLHEDSKFWVVRPRIQPGGVSGLDTLLSGAYIEMEPGKSPALSRQFEGLNSPPETSSEVEGMRLTLDNSTNKTLQAGAPILFGGMPAGRVEDINFDVGRRITNYTVFIDAPYDSLITDNTRFWFNSGWAADISASGVRLEVGTLETIVTGGLSFGVPEGQPLGQQVTSPSLAFKVYNNEEASNERMYTHSLSYIIMANKSVRGLQPGAPVEYRGVKIGEVLRTDIDYNTEVVHLLEPGSRTPILIKVEPARLGYADTADDALLASERLDDLINQGLHGEIKTTNFLTGAQLIDLHYIDNKGDARELFAGFTVIPTAEGQVDQLLVLLENTARNINDLPLEEVTEQALATLTETQSTLDSYQQLAADYSSGSESHRDLQRNLRSLQRAIDEFTVLTRQIRHQPNSILFGSRQTSEVDITGAEQ